MWFDTLECYTHRGNEIIHLIPEKVDNSENERSKNIQDECNQDLIYGLVKHGVLDRLRFLYFLKD